MAVTIQKSSVYDEHLQTKPIKGKVTVAKKNAPEKETTHLLNPGVMIPPDKLYRIRVDGSHTVNLGNYESARIGVSLEVPSTKEDLAEAYSWAMDWVGSRIDEAVKEAKGQ